MSERASVSIRSEGGLAHFPGIAAERQAFLDRMSPDEVYRILTLLDISDFFDRPEERPDTRIRDGRVHHLSVSRNGRNRTLQISEPITDQKLAELVGIVRAVTSSDGSG